MLVVPNRLLNQPLFLAKLAKEIYADANKQGLARLDFAAIHQFLQRSYST